MSANATVTTHLPRWPYVLAVIAHPDDESFGLGAVLSAFVAAGSDVSVLCLTRGESSTLHGVDGDLAAVRSRELQLAAQALGLTRVGLQGFPDGALSEEPLDLVVDVIASFVSGQQVDGIVVFDPSGVTGHPDHQRATEAACAYASRSALPVLAWTLPEAVAEALCAETGAPFVGHAAPEIDVVIDVDRAAQQQAITCHPSQAVPGSVLWRRLELLGPWEYLRWLDPADDTTAPSSQQPREEGSAP